MTPPFPRGAWFEHTWIYIAGGCCHARHGFSCQVMFGNMILKIYFSIILYKIRPINFDPFYSRGSWFEQTGIYITWGCFPIIYSFSGQMFNHSKLFTLNRPWPFIFFIQFLCYQFYIYTEKKPSSLKKTEKAIVKIDRNQSCLL